MLLTAARSAAFTLTSTPARLPVLLSVPHAGRRYAPALLAATRLPASALWVLEDPLVDRLIGRAIDAGAAAIVAHAPRAEIDLNRSVADLDPAMIESGPRGSTVVDAPASRRAAAGLGLVPSRLLGHGAIWRRALPRSEVDRRIAEIHTPYHAAIEAELLRMRNRFGVAVLIDCHSMPPRVGSPVILGDRYGTSSAPRLVAAIEAACDAHAIPATRNDPYAGGEIVARHGRPATGIHAVQIEIDRRAYLGGDMRSAGPGFDRVAALIAAIVTAIGDTALPTDLALAAE